LIPICWFLLTNRLKSYLYTLLIVFLGGKLGVVLSALISTIFILKFKFKISTLVFLFTSIFLIIFFILILYFIKDISSVNVIHKINYNYNIWNIDIENIENFGGGRFNELVSLFKNFTFYDYILGKGIGFEYLDSNSENNFIHNVHITPFGLVSKFGVVMTLCMYMYFFYYLVKKNTRQESILTIFFKNIIIGMLFFSLTEYSFFVNLILWMSLGYLANVNRSRLCVE
jgi:hypothetical protein